MASKQRFDIKSQEVITSLCANNEGLIYAVLDAVYTESNWRFLPQDHRDELVAAGNLGLVKGCQRWQPNKGKLSPTLWWAILQEVVKVANNYGKPIQMSERQAGYGREAKAAAKERGLEAPEELLEIDAISVELETVEETEASLSPSPEDAFAQKERDEHIQEALKTLAPESQAIVAAFFGFDGTPMLQQQVAAKFGKTTREVKTILANAIEDLEPKLREVRFR